MVFLPNGSLEPLATGVADCDVGEDIIVVVGNERFCQKFVEWVTGTRAEDVVGERSSSSVCCPKGVIE